MSTPNDHRCGGFTGSGKRCARTTGLDEHGRCFQHPIDAKPPDDPLTDKQRRFVEEYVRDFNATQAAIRAGYSANTAYQIGSENLRKPQIKEQLAERFRAMAMEADEVVALITDTARASMRTFVEVDEKGRFKTDFTSEEALEAFRHVKKLSFDQYGQPKIELHDAQAARVQLGRIRNLFREQVDVTFTDARAARLREAAADLDGASDEDLAELMEAYASGSLDDEDELIAD